MYTEVAQSPAKQFHFPTGRAACVLLGYPATVLDALPERAVESFAGVGYPFTANVIRAGDVVLDVGSGSGTDVLIACRLVGTTGRVIGLDVTPAMRAKLSANAQAAGATNVEVIAGDSESIPLPAASVDVVTSNGVLNLVPDKPRAIAELARVLRPGGRVQLADIVLVTEAGEACRNQPQLWAECIVGATTEHTYHELFAAAGFIGLETLSRFDYFAHSASDETRKVAQSFGAGAFVLRARKPHA
ncbi:MAG: methyltransferase domain-containing protein [Longimicrobiales bacterium]